MKRHCIAFLFFLFLFSLVSASLAEMKTFIREYTYQASELDSKASCRAIALEQVKRQILEELGAYVESQTVVRDQQVDRDEIRTMTAGVVRTAVLDEKWDGRDYWLKARAEADPDEVAASIEKMKNDQQLVRELEEARIEAAHAMEEAKSVRDQLARAQSDNKELQEQYNEAVNQISASDWFEKGTSYSVAGDYRSAAQSYDQAVALRPDDSKVYINRSIAYIQLGNYAYAARDLDRAVRLNPQSANAYVTRASVSKGIYESRQRKAAVKKPAPRPAVDLRAKKAGGDPLQRVIDARRAEWRSARPQSENKSIAPPSASREEGLRVVPPRSDGDRLRAQSVGGGVKGRSLEELRKDREQKRRARIDELKKKAERDRLERRKTGQKKPLHDGQRMERTGRGEDVKKNQ